MENVGSMGKVKVKKRMGRPPKGKKVRGEMFFFRVSDEEKEVIKRYFGTSDKLRDFVLDPKTLEYAKMLQKAGIETMKELTRKAVKGASTSKK